MSDRIGAAGEALSWTAGVAVMLAALGLIAAWAWGTLLGFALVAGWSAALIAGAA